MSVGVQYDESSDNPSEWTYQATCDEHGTLHTTHDENEAYEVAHTHRAAMHPVPARRRCVECAGNYVTDPE